MPDAETETESAAALVPTGRESTPEYLAFLKYRESVIEAIRQLSPTDFAVVMLVRQHDGHKHQHNTFIAEQRVEPSMIVGVVEMAKQDFVNQASGSGRGIGSLLGLLIGARPS